MAASKPTITVKRGDDFSIDLTVKDTNNDTARTAKATLDAALITYEAALAADPQVPLDISNGLAAYEAAQDAYDLAIIVNITAWDIASQMRWCGKLISEFTVTKTAPLIGQFAISATKEVTELWKERLYEADVSFDYPLFGRQSSQTIYIQVVRDITHG